MKSFIRYSPVLALSPPAGAVRASAAGVTAGLGVIAVMDDLAARAGRRGWAAPPSGARLESR